MGQFLVLETDRISQFLGPETDIMGERYYIVKVEKLSCARIPQIWGHRKFQRQACWLRSRQSVPGSKITGKNQIVEILFIMYFAQYWLLFGHLFD